MAQLLLFLVVTPLAASLTLLIVERPRLRQVIVMATCAAVAAASVVLAALHGGSARVFLGLPAPGLPPHLLFAAEAAIGFFVVAVALRHRRPLPVLLALAQLGVGAWLEWGGHGHGVESARLLCVDPLSVIMILVVGVIGSLICVHALGYMRDYHRRYPMLAGRRTSFFFLLFLFLSAMFGLVVANDLSLLHLCWEITTVCSFLLIGYTRTPETIGHAFRALTMNLLGGLGFAVAILLLARQPGGLEVAALSSGGLGAAALPAVALLALAGLTKSAQMPFSSWLLGAMYAPSPTSALLHSSTMVKAGVFLLLRLAPAMAGTTVGAGVASVGLVTFLVSSLVGTTEQNAKKVLAWSTIGNLGLIVACAGVGTPAALWAGAMLVIFHAVAKSLLFLVVGTLEGRLYTKDLEHFDHLVSRLPRVAVLALTGIAGMFLAPFGVLVAKWSALRAFLALPGWLGAAALVVVAFGSGCVLYYWSKLLLKVVAMRRVPADQLAIETRVSRFEWFAEVVHAGLVVALAGGVGLVSRLAVTPWVQQATGQADLSHLALGPWMAPALVGATLFLPLAAWRASRAGDYDHAEIYVSGRSVTPDHQVETAGGGRQPLASRNYYLTGLLDGGRAFRVGTALSALVLSLTLLLGTAVQP